MPVENSDYLCRSHASLNGDAPAVEINVLLKFDDSKGTCGRATEKATGCVGVGALSVNCTMSSCD